MISKYSHKELNWIDLESPKEEEITYILEEYSIPLYIREKMLETTNKGELYMDFDYIFSSINFSQNRLDLNLNNRLTIITNDGFIISIHDKPINALKEFIKELEMNINRSDKLNLSNNKMLFAHMLTNLFTETQKELANNDTIIKSLEEQLLKKNKKLKSLTMLSFVSLGIIMLISIYVISHI